MRGDAARTWARGLGRTWHAAECGLSLWQAAARCDGLMRGLGLLGVGSCWGSIDRPNCFFLLSERRVLSQLDTVCSNGAGALRPFHPPGHWLSSPRNQCLWFLALLARDVPSGSASGLRSGSTFRIVVALAERRLPSGFAVSSCPLSSLIDWLLGLQSSLGTS